MADLPFATRLQLPSTPLSGRVRCVLIPLPEDGPATPDLPLEYKAAASVLALFGAAAQAQFFTRRSDQAVSWHAQPLSVDAQACSLVLDVDVENLPLYAWAHLLALLRKNHDALEPLQSVSVIAEGGHQTVAADEVVNAVPQALRADEPGFDWDATGAEKSRNLHLEMMFSQDISAAARQRVEDDLSVWLQLNILGAFDLRFDPADDLDPLGTVQMTSPIRMECFVPYYRGDMSGFVALECWLRDMHRHTLGLDEACLA